MKQLNSLQVAALLATDLNGEHGPLTEADIDALRDRARANALTPADIADVGEILGAYAHHLLETGMAQLQAELDTKIAGGLN